MNMKQNNYEKIIGICFTRKTFNYTDKYEVKMYLMR